MYRYYVLYFMHFGCIPVLKLMTLERIINLRYIAYTGRNDLFRFWENDDLHHNNLNKIYKLFYQYVKVKAGVIQLNIVYFNYRSLDSCDHSR